VNQAPSVSAGADKTVTLAAGATLLGSASDDGLPNGSSLITSWTKVSGPGTVQFSNAAGLSTTATFSAAGSYTLRLTASDGVLTSTDDVVVIVDAGSSSCGPLAAGTMRLTADASDDVGVIGVQFTLDGANLGPEQTSAPYSMDWNTLTVANGCHTLTAVARDAAGNRGIGTLIVNVSNP
jgi:hypothetical protein